MAANNNRTHGDATAMQFKLTTGQLEEKLSDAGNTVIKPTPDARVVDMRSQLGISHSISGQTLAGSGAMVFEGEILENLHRGLH